MNTSRILSLVKPAPGDTIPPSSFVYLRARAQQRAYNLVLKEFKRSGISRAELARRLGKGADQVSRMLGGPGNWTIATVSDLLFAISCAAPTYALEYPLDKSPRNQSGRDRFFVPAQTPRTEAPVKTKRWELEQAL